MGLCFAGFVYLTFRRPLASHDSNPYPSRSRIAQYNATKVRDILALAFLLPQEYRAQITHYGAL